MELPISGTWSFTGSMGVSRALHTATLMAGGKVLVAGGYAPAAGVVSATAEIYDSVLGTWSSTTSMSTGRNSSTATLLSDGRVLLAGGVSEEGVQPALKARRGTKATLSTRRHRLRWSTRFCRGQWSARSDWSCGRYRFDRSNGRSGPDWPDRTQR